MMLTTSLPMLPTTKTHKKINTKTKTGENFQEESFTDGGDHCPDHKEGEGEETEEDLCPSQMHVGDFFVQGDPKNDT